LGKCQLESRDDNERFGKRDKDIRRSLDPHMYAPGRRDVDIMLQHAGVYHGHRGEHEASEDAGDGVEVDFQLAEAGVDEDWR
jgi:hypothetical protein